MKHAGKIVFSVFYAISARKKLCSYGIVCGIMHKVNEPFNMTVVKHRLLVFTIIVVSGIKIRIMLTPQQNQKSESVS